MRGQTITFLIYDNNFRVLGFIAFVLLGGTHSESINEVESHDASRNQGLLVHVGLISHGIADSLVRVGDEGKGERTDLGWKRRSVASVK